LAAPLVLVDNAKIPVAVFPPPVELLFKASKPVAVLALPVVFFSSAFAPVEVFYCPFLALDFYLTLVPGACRSAPSADHTGLQIHSIALQIRLDSCQWMRR
jgi:hypothetical protein